MAWRRCSERAGAFISGCLNVPLVQNKTSKSRLVVQLDESCLNKDKISSLAPNFRPQKDKIWLCGLVVQGQPENFFLKALNRLGDAWAGKPHGFQQREEQFNEV
eukprot:TRINITY_DN22712_c0_g1_i1.p1 TRINITY_DN22712_c0_g1~~TRINITY_DN22712_c0_g1_i1.p1  ORF type:complete len:104 (-),score=17.51 TRINITY_DN22712_c0_g1_i1:673-984(-)